MRRKVLLGTLVLDRLMNDSDDAFSRRLGDWLRDELPGFLTREADKVLFADLMGNGDVDAGSETGSAASLKPDPRETACSVALTFGADPMLSIFNKAALTAGMEAQTVIEHIHHKSIESDQSSIEFGQAGSPI
jgi:hypothetical protein